MQESPPRLPPEPGEVWGAGEEGGECGEVHPAGVLGGEEKAPGEGTGPAAGERGGLGAGEGGVDLNPERKAITGHSQDSRPNPIITHGGNPGTFPKSWNGRAREA